MNIEMNSFVFMCLLGAVVAYISAQRITPVTLPNEPIKDALYLHNTSITNNTLRDCVFRPYTQDEPCIQDDVKFILYSGGSKQYMESSSSDYLRHSIWDPTKENIFLVHGYAGGDDTLPIVVLRDAYINNGSYNLWMVDWGALSQPPCYRAAVHNTRAVAKCTGHVFSALREAGMQIEKSTCVGHSLGAHICGLISKFVLFRLHRIIALDPARPLVTGSNRLSSGDAAAVHVLHTNAGHYGEAGRAGHVDFCINGGKIQPYCENSGIDTQLCSHVWALCYMAESLHPSLARRAEPCSRRCPTGPRPAHRIGNPITMGQFTPLTVSGSYCLHHNTPPYCPAGPGEPGDKRCCIKPASSTATTKAYYLN